MKSNINLVLLIFFFANHSFALIQTKKRFEWGIGSLVMRGHHYRSSNQQKNYFYPLPYFAYRSENVEAEPSFVRGKFYSNKFLDIKLSLMAGLDVESKKNHSRSGMPDIDHTFEVGPLFIYKLFNNKVKDRKLTIEWAFRQSYATDLSYIDPIGFYSIAYLNYIAGPQKKVFGWSYEFSMGPMWGSRKFHNYFYGVPIEYQRENRQKYSSKSGYSGFQTTLILNKRTGKFIFVPFARWDYLKGSAMDKSPLYEKDNYLIAGFGAFFLF